MTARMRAAFVISATVLVAAVVMPRGVSSQQAGAPPQAGPPAAAPKPLVPLTAATIVRDLATHTGENASMVAAVEAVLSKTVFTVDQDRTKSTGQEVLVIAPTLSEPPGLNLYVTVQGEVFPFDPEALSRKARAYVLDVPPDALEKYRGKPAVLATAVITAALVDLAKKPLPPVTPDDVVLGGHMRALNPAFLALRGGLDKPDAKLIGDQIATIKKSFADVETFFKLKGVADAMQWSADAVRLVNTMEQGAAAAKWDDVKASAGTLQQTCTACHTQHRERVDDGSYRLKIGG